MINIVFLSFIQLYLNVARDKHLCSFVHLFERLLA